jgi:hypothetical protein
MSNRYGTSLQCLVALMLCIGCRVTDAQQPRRGFVTGHELVSWMREHEALLARQSSAELITAGFYQGYVLGIYDDLALQGLMCKPEGASVAQVTAVVSKYLQGNPDKWSKPATLLVLNAFGQAFPCTRMP